MAGRATIAQVAEEAGVSAMTVSNVINGKPGASEETRRRVMEVAGRLGYRPNVSARNLKAGRSGLIGLIALDLTSQYGLEILRGVADELASAEQELLVNATYHDAVREKDRIEFLARGLVDGVLMIAPVLEDETVELLRRQKLPCVIIDPRRLDVPLPRLSVDNYHGMRQGTQHLIDLGHTRIAYLRGEEDPGEHVHPLPGLRGRDAARRTGGRRAAGRHVRLLLRCGFRTTARLIDDHSPTAIVAGADLMALGAVDAARARGLSVPTDFSVVGFDDLPQAAQSFPGLTTVRQPLHDMGQKAARALLSLIEGQRLLMEHMEVGTELVVRNSTAPPPPRHGVTRTIFRPDHDTDAIPALDRRDFRHPDAACPISAASPGRCGSDSRVA